MDTKTPDRSSLSRQDEPRESFVRLGDGGRSRIRTYDFHRVKVATVGRFIDGKGVTNRTSRLDRQNRRYLLPNCYQFFQLITAVGKWAERAGSAHISNRRPKPYPRLSWFSAGSRGTIDTRASLAGYAQKRSISWASLYTALAIKKETFESGFLRRTHDCDAHSSAWGIRPPAEISVKIHHRLFRQSKTASDVPICGTWGHHTKSKKSYV